jgi:hypothetical protein
MCGSSGAHIEWDAESRRWYCVLRDEPRAAPKRAPARAPAPERLEPPLPALRCRRCERVLLEGAAEGVSAYCARCRRWAVQGPQADAGGAP